LQVQRYARTRALEAIPQLRSLNLDAAAINLDDEAAGSIVGVKLRLQRGIDLLEQAVDFPAPGDEQSALSQQSLRIVLESGGIALAEPVDGGFRFDACDSRDRLVQLRARHTREVFEQRALVALLRTKQHRPLLELDENERVKGRRQTREHLAVLPRQRRGVARQDRGELHRSAKASRSSVCAKASRSSVCAQASRSSVCAKASRSIAVRRPARRAAGLRIPPS